MDSEEIDKRLKDGELLFCPECDLFYPESETCQIIVCTNPFLGPSDLDIENYSEKTKQYFNERYKGVKNNE